MGKIVVLASGKDADAVDTALSSAGLDYEVVDPTPGNLLHIVIGMVDDDEPKEKDEPKEPKEPKEKDEPKEPAADEELPEQPVEELPVEESLEVLVDGVRIPVSLGATTCLHAPLLGLGEARVVVQLAEDARVGFWQNNKDEPRARLDVCHKARSHFVEVPLRHSEARRLIIGPELQELLQIK